MSKGKILLINFIGLVVILGLIALGAYFYYQNKNYVKTDDQIADIFTKPLATDRFVQIRRKLGIYGMDDL